MNNKIRNISEEVESTKKSMSIEQKLLLGGGILAGVLYAASRLLTKNSIELEDYDDEEDDLDEEDIVEENESIEE